MKFAVFALLFSTASAVRIQHQPHSLAKVNYGGFKKFLKTRDDDLPADAEKEIEEWAEHELTTGEKTITGEEAIQFFGDFAKKHGYKMGKYDWAYLGYMFGQADTNHDGELDLDEVSKAMDEDVKIPKKFIKTRDEPELDSEDEDEIEAWVEHELTTGDKTITKKEAHDAIAGFAKKKGWKISKEDWEALEEAFDAADTNGDGELDLDEVMNACEGMEDLKSVSKKYVKKINKLLKVRDDDEGEQEIMDWAEKQLTTGDGTITKDEAEKFFKGFAKKHGFKITKEMWDELEAGFDAADTNHDGEIDLNEAMAAWGDELKMPNLLKTRDPEAEIEKWAEHELTTGDKTITKDEAYKFFKAFAKKHGYKMTKDDWDQLEDMFDAADTNHDGELDLDEVVAACGGEELKIPKSLFKKFLKSLKKK